MMHLFTPQSNETEPYPLPEEFYRRFEELSRAAAEILAQKMKIEAQETPAEPDTEESNVTSLEAYKRQKEVIERQALLDQELSELRSAVSTAIDSASVETSAQAIDNTAGEGYAEKAA